MRLERASPQLDLLRFGLLRFESLLVADVHDHREEALLLSRS